jgi:uncharacterized protein YjbJ (UPF0337 family)
MSADKFVSSLSQAARDNPLAAALIGGGALWLLLGNRGIDGAITGARSIAQPLAESGMRGMSGAADSLSSAAGAVSSATGRAADAATEAAQSMMRNASEASAAGSIAVRDRMANAAERATDTLGQGKDSLLAANPMPHLQQGYAEAKSALTDLLDRQPLVLGAIGLAIGAGVANAIASTALEKEWVGSTSNEVKDALQGRAEQIAATAQRAAGEVGSEFRAAASEAADTLRKAGQDVVQSVRETAHAKQP